GSTARTVVEGRSLHGTRRTVLESSDEDGHWTADGRAVPALEGCRDVDLEASALTNAFPVRRHRPPVGARFDAPAVYVRAVDLTVIRLEQSYARVPDDTAGHLQFDYAAPEFEYADRLTYDASGLVVDYPQLAVRAR
ncbi:MAG: hypothetical protein HOV94_06545, partial [Saccharothrix sp.]|nr:hypothetical protein [Saccharothrix sp.]